MPDEQPPEFTAKIAAAYVRRNPISVDELDTLIFTVHRALVGLGKPAEPVVERIPAVPIRRSITPNSVIWPGLWVEGQHVAASRDNGSWV